MFRIFFQHRVVFAQCLLQLTHTRQRISPVVPVLLTIQSLVLLQRILETTAAVMRGGFPALIAKQFSRRLVVALM